MLTELIILNFLFMIIMIMTLTRSWSFVMMVLLIEGLWVVLFCLFVLSAQYLNDLSFFMVGLLILVLSAVELTIAILLFIIQYELTNELNIFASSKKKINRNIRYNSNKLSRFDIYNRRFKG